MTYVALLRGINVGGKNKIEMRRLRATFGRAGMGNVSTNINSGNVIFGSDSADELQLAATLEDAIESDFGLRVPVTLRKIDSIAATAEALPEHWANDADAKCDVMFLWDEIDSADLLNSLVIKRDTDEVIYVAGALLWRVERANVTRSGLLKIVGTDTYRKMTVRNCNTLRKLAALMKQADAAGR